MSWSRSGKLDSRRLGRLTLRHAFEVCPDRTGQCVEQVRASGTVDHVGCAQHIGDARPRGDERGVVSDDVRGDQAVDGARMERDGEPARSPPQDSLPDRVHHLDVSPRCEQGVERRGEILPRHAGHGSGGQARRTARDQDQRVVRRGNARDDVGQALGGAERAGRGDGVVAHHDRQTVGGIRAAVVRDDQTAGTPHAPRSERLDGPRGHGMRSLAKRDDVHGWRQRGQSRDGVTCHTARVRHGDAGAPGLRQDVTCGSVVHRSKQRRPGRPGRRVAVGQHPGPGPSGRGAGCGAVPPLSGGAGTTFFTSASSSS